MYNSALARVRSAATTLSEIMNSESQNAQEIGNLKFELQQDERALFLSPQRINFIQMLVLDVHSLNAHNLYLFYQDVHVLSLWPSSLFPGSFISTFCQHIPSSFVFNDLMTISMRPCLSYLFFNRYNMQSETFTYYLFGRDHSSHSLVEPRLFHFCYFQFLSLNHPFPTLHTSGIPHCVIPSRLAALLDLPAAFPFL